MKDETQPSLENIFWFDSGRSYQLGVLCSITRKRKFSLDEFQFYGHPILIRYLTDERAILELFRAYEEGFDKGNGAVKELVGRIISAPEEVT